MCTGIFKKRKTEMVGGGYVHRWVRGSVAQWLEPSIHKQLLIPTNPVQIKKKRRME